MADFSSSKTEFSETEFDALGLDFEQLQSELHYCQAQQLLQDWVTRLDLSERERSSLNPLLANLADTLDRLENGKVQIAAFGMVGRGKSSLLNALVGQPVFQTGPLHGVTQDIGTSQWSLEQIPVAGTDTQVQQFGLRREGLATVELVDTPGIDEVNGQQREALALAVAERADLILFVVTGDITSIEYEALTTLRQVSKPMLLVFNKIDQYPEADRQAIYEKIRDDRLKSLLSPEEIVMVAASPLKVEAMRQADGQIQVKRSPGSPQINALKQKILEVLNREGRALVALNTLLFADEANGQIIARKMAIRDRSADQLIWNATLMKATAIAINPVTVLDLLGGAAVDVYLILSLSKLYGIPMTEPGAIALLQRIALAMGGLGLSELLATLGLGSLKTLLGAAIPVSGGTSMVPYVSVAATQAAVAGVSSYGIGQITKQYLAQGATWGEEGPKAMAMRILESLDQTSILNRLKVELSSKLNNQ